MKLFTILVAAALLSISSAWAAENLPLDRTYIGQGNLLTVRIVVGDKQAKLFLVGKETAKLDLNKNAKLLSLSAFNNEGKKQELHFSEEAGYYTVSEFPKNYHMLSVSAKVADKEEQVKIKMERQP